MRFHVPLLIYAPGLLAPGRSVDTVASEVDVLPTVAGVTGTPYRNTTLGRDLLDPRFDGQRYAFTMTDQFRVPEIGLLGDRLLPAHAARRRRAHPPRPAVGRPGGRRRERASRTRRRACRRSAAGLYETARYMLVHNKPAPPAARGTGGGGQGTGARERVPEDL